MAEVITKWPFETQVIRAGEEFAHTYRQAYDARAPNPMCDTRFALVGPPGQPNLRAAYYIASTHRGALWEIILRSVHPNQFNGIYVPPGLYAGRRLVRLRATRDIPAIIRVDRPHRLRFVDGESPEETAWERACADAVHAISHGVALAAERFLHHQGFQHAGFGWRSKQFPDDLVYLLYAPPFEPAAWEVLEIIDLASSAGIALMRDAITAPGFVWLDPPPDAPALPEPPEL